MDRNSWHGRWLTAAVLFASLSGCAAQPAHRGLTQQALFDALTAVKASDEQRAKVLGYYETLRPKSEELRDEAEQLRIQIHELEPRTAGFIAKADKLAAQLGAVASEQQRVQSRFVHQVATTLSARQWDNWLAYFRDPVEENWDARRARMQSQR
jgi:uncharacterized protein (DUF3084 family)